MRRVSEAAFTIATQTIALQHEVSIASVGLKGMSDGDQVIRDRVGVELIELSRRSPWRKVCTSLKSSGMDVGSADINQRDLRNTLWDISDENGPPGLSLSEAASPLEER